MKMLNAARLLLVLMLWIPLGCQLENKTDGLSNKGFSQLKSTASGISFSNDIAISDAFNYNTFPYIYMGAGVALGDINNDDLTDVFLIGNMVPNTLYLNKGAMKFEDISDKSSTAGDSRWYTGVTMVDINADGWLDIYVSVSGLGENTANQLFVNNGDLTFTEMAVDYGIADKGNSIQSTFFDYDNDGDLDLFVANYPIISLTLPNFVYQDKMPARNPEESGHLFRNEGEGNFKEVTQESGLLNFGLSLGVVVSDFNNDGWKDLYISNDFNVPDYFYINNKDGTFSEKIKETTRQTSMFGMGVDAADFNNDGLVDLIQVDMTPADHYRSKTNMASMTPQAFHEGVSMGFHYQYMQNSLQVNNGFDAEGTPILSNISRLAGMATTDWSWGALFADFDNDGLKDIVITNGMRLDVNNNDLLNQENNMSIVPKKIDMNNAPSTPIENYLFKNKGNYAFEDVSQEWNANIKGFSNGIAYGDLDNDGDLDLVVNNIDQQATLLQNNNIKANYLRIKLKGSEKNPMGIGTKISVTTGGIVQWLDHTLSRGFQSSIEPILHFGLGEVVKVDQLKIVWPDGKVQFKENLDVDQILELKFSDAIDENQIIKSSETGFKDISTHAKINFTHVEDAYDDYFIEPLLPHKNSELGPGLTVGDINNDGLEDFFIGNARNKAAALFIQGQNGVFEEIPGPWITDKTNEDTGSVFFDADMDGDLDLYVVSGGNTIAHSDKEYQDRLYMNTPEGFVKIESALPLINSSGLKVLPIDYDGDGDLDLFVGGRIQPGYYLQPPRSYLLQNEGGKGLGITFKDVTSEVAPELQNIGLVTDALAHDFNNDGTVDLILVGEWMPITFFENDGQKLSNVTKRMHFDDTVGWWNSLDKADLDDDGDMDLVAGNLGLNSKYKTSVNSPFEVYINDFDGNKRQDIVLSVTKKGTKLPLRGRECSSEQIPMIKKNFETYDLFASASLDDIYGEDMLKKSLHHKVDTFAHHWFENKSDGNYKRHILPLQSQFSSINDIVVFDYDGDVYPDLFIAGNLYDTEVETPRSDAGIGLVLQNNGEKGFNPVTMDESGLLINQEVKVMAPIKLGTNRGMAYILAINNDRLRMLAFKSKDKKETISAQ